MYGRYARRRPHRLYDSGSAARRRTSPLQAAPHPHRLYDGYARRRPHRLFDSGSAARTSPQASPLRPWTHSGFQVQVVQSSYTWRAGRLGAAACASRRSSVTRIQVLTNPTLTRVSAWRSCHVLEEENHRSRNMSTPVRCVSELSGPSRWPRGGRHRPAGASCSPSPAGWRRRRWRTPACRLRTHGGACTQSFKGAIVTQGLEGGGQKHPCRRRGTAQRT